MRGDAASGGTLDAVRLGIVLSCAELLLARLSDVPQWPGDLLLSGLLGVAATVAAARFAAAIPWPASIRGAALAAGCALPAAAVAAGIAFLRLRHEIPLAAGVLAAGLFVAVVVAAQVAARRRSVRIRLPEVAVGGVAVASAATWWVVGPPPLSVCLAIALAWLLLLVMARSPAGLAVALVATVVVALAPFEIQARFPDRVQGEPIPRGPDLIVVVADTLRADAARAMQLYRQLAAGGVAYERAQAAGSWTLPSMATLMTGMPVARHGAGRVPGPGRVTTPISSALPTLAEQLGGGGYDTAAILAPNPSLSARYGFARGFDHFDLGGESYHRGALPGSNDFVARPLVVQMLILAARRIQSPRLHQLLDLGRREDAGRPIAQARRWLAQRGERPIFLWLHLMEPHLPYRHVVEMGLPAEFRDALLNASRAGIREDSRWREPTGREALRAAYHNEIQSLDRHLLDFFEALGPPGERGRVVVFVSDHGEEFWENGGFEHGHAFYQGVVSVPLVVHGVAPERLRDPNSVVGHANIAPTLLELAGMASRPGGATSLLRDEPGASAITQNLLYGKVPGRAVRRGDWKLVDVGGRHELYDLAADPGERLDLVGTRPEAELLKALLPAGGAQGDSVVPSLAERAALEALGYVESAVE